MTRDDPGASNPTIADGVDEPPGPNQRKLISWQTRLLMSRWIWVESHPSGAKLNPNHDAGVTPAQQSGAAYEGSPGHFMRVCTTTYCGEPQKLTRAPPRSQ